MRIAYPIVWNAFSSSGVLTKVETQAREWCRRGHEVRVFVVTPPGEGPVAIDAAVACPIVVPFASFRSYGILKKISSCLAIGILTKNILEYRPDIIYQRDTMWYSALFNRLPWAVPYILELNTLVRPELELLKRNSALQGLKERLLFSGAAGFLAVSDEIARYYDGYGKPITVIANGFPVTSFKPRPPPYNDRPQLVLTGTPGLPWHGVDKVLRLAARISEWDFHLVGPEHSELGVEVPPNIFAHGYLQHGEIALLYQRMDAGLGTLALHRKEMTEASPLKVREYLAHGLPVIAGYRDTDLSGCEFYLDIGNTEDNVLAQEENIRKFVAHWRDRPISRAEVLGRIDAENKETLRLQFMGEVVQRVGGKVNSNGGEGVR